MWSSTRLSLRPSFIYYYINDLIPSCLQFNSCNIICYDILYLLLMKIYLLDVMNSDLEKLIYDWFKANKLSLNVSKS